MRDDESLKVDADMIKKLVADTPRYRTFDLKFVDGQPVFELSEFHKAFTEALNAAYGPSEDTFLQEGLVRSPTKQGD